MGRDSFRNFDSCYLCLQTARDPLTCLQGHLGCKQCIYENILTQKKNHQAILEENAKNIKRLTQNTMKTNLEKQEKEFIDFQLTQDRFVKDNDTTSSSTKKALPSFWVPSKTPQAASDEVSVTPINEKCDVKCMATSDPHSIVLKKLVPVVFKFGTDDEKDKPVCPSCLKEYTNGSRIFCKNKSSSDTFLMFLNSEQGLWTCAL